MTHNHLQNQTRFSFRRRREEKRKGEEGNIPINYSAAKRQAARQLNARRQGERERKPATERTNDAPTTSTTTPPPKKKPETQPQKAFAENQLKIPRVRGNLETPSREAEASEEERRAESRDPQSVEGRSDSPIRREIPPIGELPGWDSSCGIWGR